MNSRTDIPQSTYSLTPDIISSCVNGLKKPTALNALVNQRKQLLDDMTDIGAIYVFWWKGDLKEIIDKHIELKGPGGQPVQIIYNKKWIEAATHDKQICLYLGKTTKLRKRLQLHLKLGSPSDRITANEGVINTVSQLRIGIETLFPDMKSGIVDFMLENLSVSWIKWDGHANAVNRFYLEDYLIGSFNPLFNVDIER